MKRVSPLPELVAIADRLPVTHITMAKIPSINPSKQKSSERLVLPAVARRVHATSIQQSLELARFWGKRRTEYTTGNICNINSVLNLSIQAAVCSSQAYTQSRDGSEPSNLLLFPSRQKTARLDPFISDCRKRSRPFISPHIRICRLCFHAVPVSSAIGTSVAAATLTKTCK